MPDDAGYSGESENISSPPVQVVLMPISGQYRGLTPDRLSTLACAAPTKLEASAAGVGHVCAAADTSPSMLAKDITTHKRYVIDLLLFDVLNSRIVNLQWLSALNA